MACSCAGLMQEIQAHGRSTSAGVRPAPDRRSGDRHTDKLLAALAARSLPPGFRGAAMVAWSTLHGGLRTLRCDFGRQLAKTDRRLPSSLFLAHGPVTAASIRCWRRTRSVLELDRTGQRLEPRVCGPLSLFDTVKNDNPGCLPIYRC